MTSLNPIPLFPLESFTEEAIAAGNDEFRDFYSNLTYLCIYAFLWNFLIEISLIIIFHYKQYGSYVANHSFINVCIIVTQLINNIFLLKDHPINMENDYLIYAGSLLGLEILQMFLGSKTNDRLFKTKLRRSIFVLGFLHRNAGKLLYILRKCQLAYYAFYYFKFNTSVSPYLIIILVYSLTFIFHTIAYIVFKTGEFSDRKHAWKFLINESKNKQAYSELLQGIKNDDHDNSLTASISFVSEITGLKESLLEEKEVKWVLIENRVYDITNIRHPKGNFIFSHIYGKDITREINGLKTMRFSDPVKRYTINLTHKHVPITFKCLANNCIGELDYSGMITDTINDNGPLLNENSEMTIQLSYLVRKFRFANLQFIKRQFYWTIDNAFEFDENYKIIFCYKSEKDFVVNLSSYWLYDVGKYFLIKRDDDKKDYMYPILSLSPFYLKLKKEWFDSFDDSIKKEFIKFKNSDLAELESLYDILYDKTDSQQRRLTGLGEDVKTAFLPLFYDKQRNKNSNHIFEGSKFGVAGPLGTGLGFNSDSTSKVIFIVQDAGILPLTDFLEFLSQRALLESTNFENQNTIFKKEYIYSFANDIKFCLYWEISESFYTMAESLGLNSIFTTDKAYQMNKDTNVLLQKSIIVSPCCKYEGKHVEVRKSMTANIDDIMILMNSRNTGEIKRFIIKGEDSFVDRILKTCNFNMEKVLIL